MTNLEDLKDIYSVDDGQGDYEWGELHVYVHQKVRRKFALLTDSGCSCNYYGEFLTVEDVESATPLGIREVRAQLSAWLREQGYSADGIARELERVTLAMRDSRD